MRPLGIGRSRVRAIAVVDVAVEIHVDRVRAARHQVAADEHDQSTSSQPGLPATNIGAIVVTSSSEMMRGLVSITMSRSSDGCACSRSGDFHQVLTPSGVANSPRDGDSNTMRSMSRHVAAVRSPAPRAATTRDPERGPDRLMNRAKRSGEMHLDHRGRNDDLQRHDGRAPSTPPRESGAARCACARQ